MKKRICNILLVLFTFSTWYACTEKVLILPEETSDNLEILPTRPPLRPSEVEVYSAFYHSIEIQYPEVQPDRAVKSIITYMGDDNQVKTIEVTDFDQVVTIENLSLREYEFKITYVTADGVTSRTVVKKATPYAALTDYPFATLEGYGEFGVVYVHWENVTDREVEVVVKYEEGGQTKSASKLSAKLRDTLAIRNLPNADVAFDVQVKDPVREYASEVKQLTINAGLSVEDYALSTLEAATGFGRAFLTWVNPQQADLRLDLSYVVSGQTKTATYESTAEDGAYTLVNLPEGAMNIVAKFTNTEADEESDNKTVAVTVDKGVKETVSEGVTVSSYGFNLGALRVKNPASIPVDVKVTYKDKTGSDQEETFTVPANTIKYSVPLHRVMAGSSIDVEITDDIGTLNRTISSTISDAPLSPTNIELNRTGWGATSSSFRISGAGVRYTADRLLDGLFGATNVDNGWVNEWGRSDIDALGKPSNVFPHYIQVDMLEVKYVTGISFVNHTNGVQDGPGTFTIQYSFDGVTFHDGQTMTRTNAGANARTHHYLDEPLLARYIRVYITAGDRSASNDAVVRLAEFYVYGRE
ncbi:discoidin domain-containing protein [Sphingobacterium sp. SGG-5]|uniref:discoidin domain-containing protein n=1 Tax=Sphingobacterium sp. SGG-5 TaxID=2710881 RepID=UPI0013EB425B|nr:discoidin domain-containing protein [Sphingobacterium sp. SGG-5]NGM62517.1 discoidin domain-containing protein [Sphingobacterium sp. SGG-5]